MMNWYRVYHNMQNDPKIAIVAKRSGARRGEVLAVWVACLDYASQQEDRGSVQGIDPEEVGISLDFEPEMVARVFDGFRERGMFTVTPSDASETQPVERIAAWDRRQPIRERDDSSTERTRRYRENKRAKIPQALHDVTPSDATVTPSDAHIRLDKTRREETIKTLSECVTPELGQEPFNLDPSEMSEGASEFDQWWGHWWNKSAKQEAARAFKAARHEYSLAFLIEQCKADRAQWEPTEGWAWRSKLHGATWLRGKRWEDQLPPTTAGKPAGKESTTALVDRICSELDAEEKEIS
ncbi:MAG TPA: hypothetical protein VIN93_02140 [Bryobacteraceae bacterium]